MKQKNFTLSLFRNFLFFLAILFSASVSAQTYCTPSYLTTSSSGGMSNFALTGYGGSSISDAMSTSSNYYDKTTSVGICDLQQGGSYACTITYQSGTTYTDNQIWIDFNDDGVFDTTTEKVTSVFPSTGVTTTSISSASSNIVIPIGALPGNHRMRVRNVWYWIGISGSGGGSPTYPSPAFDPCNGDDNWTSYFSGVTADYEVNIVALAACSGKPTAGHLTGPTFICTNRTFTMVDTALLKYGGMTMQWQESVPGSGVWTDISGATQQSYTTSLTSSMDFRMWAICNSCGTGASCTDTSYVLSVVTDSFFHCYCALSTTGTPLGGGTPPTIDSVSILRTTLKNPTHYSLPAPDYYGSYKDTLNATATLKQGGLYKIYVGYKGGLSYGSAWIDYNRNGIFESSEFIEINSILASSGIATFNVPANATLGKTGLRIRNSVVYSPYSGDACTNYTSSSGAGETQDYIVTIAPAPGHDLGVSDIISPADNATLCANAIDSIYANVYNFGENGESNFYVYATYTNPSGVAHTIYTKYIGTVDPASGTSIYVGTINPPDAGKYTIKAYTVISGDTIANNDTAYSTMTLKPSPELPVVSSDTVCLGTSSATVYVTQVPGVTNLWYASLGDEFPFTTDTATSVSYPTADTTFFVTAKGANGCETNKVPAHIVIGNPPVVNIGPDVTMCESPTFMLDAGVADAKYLWSTGDTTKTIHVRTSGTYSVSVFKYCTASDTAVMTINPLPSATGIDYTRAGTSYLFDVAGGKNINSYMWFFGDGDTSSLAAPLHTYKTGDIRTVEVVLYNNCGTDTVTWTIPTGIGSLSQQNGVIKIYPNPANNVVTLTTDNNAVDLKEIQVINTIGVQVFKANVTGNIAEIKVSQFPAGHYILRANTSKGYINRIFEVIH